MDVEVGGLAQVQPLEICILVCQDIASGLEASPSEMDRLAIRDGIAPAEVVVPGPHADVAEDGPAAAQPDRSRTVHVAEDLVIVEGEERRHFLVPARHGRSAFEIDLVVLPNTGDCRGDAEDSRQLGSADSGNRPPTLRGITPPLLIQPVPVLDRKVHPVLEPIEHRGKRRKVPIG